MQVNFDSVHYFQLHTAEGDWLHQYFEMTIEVDEPKCNEQVRSLSFWIGEEGSYDE